ncbi:hypothetical protein [Marinobacter caseinilyticus]|uniref:hypothetical protein n=1 Tax=Marinobacter caseinilyticus TaxID=2692195 RepID=UPI001407521F|nr:hypothetical protein [Marinobacter caseinilyticus]
MLKELWRKTLGHPSLSLAGESRHGRALSLSSHLTHTGEFHLERLKQLIEQRYDRAFTNDQDESLKQLVQFAARIQDQDIQREFLLFYLNCSPAVQEYLRSRDIVNPDHFLSQSS